MKADAGSSVAAKKGITVRYRTDLTTGLIKGVSFERNGIRFQGGRLDRSLAATKILPIETQRSLTAHQRATLITPEVEKLLKAGGKARKDCKDRIKDIENILADYTEEELEVRKYKISIKVEQMARLVCYHPSTDQMVNYRIHTTPDGIVTKVEMEKKVKGKSVWVELKRLSTE